MRLQRWIAKTRVIDGKSIHVAYSGVAHNTDSNYEDCLSVQYVSQGSYCARCEMSGRSHDGGTDESLPVVDDALFARRLWEEWYARGVEDGWTAGWQSMLNPEPEVPELELNPEWAKLFAEGEERRRRENEQMKREERSKSAQIRDINLGADNDERRKSTATRLYAQYATKVLATEARIDARFIREASKAAAPLWPVLPLANERDANA